MPSTTTTSVTLGSILDLLGSGAQSSGLGKDQPPFDALLRSPALPSFEPSNERFGPSAPRPENNPSDLPRLPSNTNINSTDSTPSQPPAASSDELTSPEAETDGDDPPQHEAEQSSTDDGLLVESLAGLAAQTSPIAAVHNSVVAEATGGDAEQVAREAELAASTNERAGVPISPAGPAAFAQGATGNAPGSAEPAAADASVEQNPDATGQDPTAAIDLEGANVEARLHSTGSSDHESKGLKIPSEPSGETSADSRGHDDENSAHNKSDSIDLILNSENTPLSTPTATETANPLSAAPLATPSSTDSISAPSSSGSESAIATAPPPLRTRLPAEVLAQPTGVSNRRSAIAIDSTRLLTRVARAFAAAQERDGEIRLRLSPPELGSLRLDVRIHDGALVAHLQTETDAARVAILENLPALRERLSDQGVKIERFDVDLMQRQPGDMPDQSGWQQPEAPATPNQIAPVARPRSTTLASNQPSPAVGSTGGLNVIV